MKPNKNSPAKTRRLALQEQAIELRRSGLGYVEIGAKLNIGKSTAHRLIEAGMESARAQITASVDQLRAEEVSRLDGILATLYPSAAAGDVQAIDRVIKIGERRAKLLGLDAPVRMAHGGDSDAPPVSTVSESKVYFYMPDNGRV